jgi:hypothetical protein
MSWFTPIRTSSSSDRFGTQCSRTKMVHFGCFESWQQSATSFPVTCAGIGPPSDFSASHRALWRCPTTSAAWFRGVGKSPSHAPGDRSSVGPCLNAHPRPCQGRLGIRSLRPVRRRCTRPIQPWAGRHRLLVPLLLGIGAADERRTRTIIREASPEEVAVMVSAKAGTRPADYAEVLERRWAALQTSDS